MTTATVTRTADSDDVQARIVTAAAELICSGGQDALTTRAVAAAASVQAPAIYRIFGDKRGLLDAVAEHVLAAYVKEKSAQQPHPDPVQELRNAWDRHVDFGMANPALFTIMRSDIHPGTLSPAAEAGLELLRLKIRHIALAGRLKVSEDRATSLIISGCDGTIMTLLSEPLKHRDEGLSACAREAIINSITANNQSTTGQGACAAAATLCASLNQVSVLTEGETHLLKELLKRIADTEHQV